LDANCKGNNFIEELTVVHDIDCVARAQWDLRRNNSELRGWHYVGPRGDVSVYADRGPSGGEQYSGGAMVVDFDRLVAEATSRTPIHYPRRSERLSIE
jgi:hypothetical protein